MKRFLSLLTFCCLFAVGGIVSGCEFVGPEISAQATTGSETGGACHNTETESDCKEGAEHNDG